MNMKELIEKLEKRPPVDEEEKEQMLQWVKEVEDFFNTIQKWLTPAVEEKVLKVFTQKEEITRFGTYEISTLWIDDGKILVHLRPDNVFRVNIISGPIKIPIIYRNSKWEIQTSQKNVPFTEDNFASILEEIFIDE